MSRFTLRRFFAGTPATPRSRRSPAMALFRRGERFLQKMTAMESSANSVSNTSSPSRFIEPEKAFRFQIGSVTTTAEMRASALGVIYHQAAMSWHRRLLC